MGVDENLAVVLPIFRSDIENWNTPEPRSFCSGTELLYNLALSLYSQADQPLMWDSTTPKCANACGSIPWPQTLAYLMRMCRPTPFQE